ncbi:MAG: amidohydrolase [Phenylobacterium sp.]|uniref:amidohydrolase n=1 Tax=Phenylobacterium sp. TaxID=1871053 RepID=UPI001A522BD7|nr:amidohydrolase [Phenylobacterium sp.]MBL8556182.1 amidohydrolase [Phenylobacterium sp.]
MPSPRLNPVSAAVLAACLLGGGVAHARVADAQRTQIRATVDRGATHLGEVAQQIWGFAEVGYQETKSSALLQQELKRSGFEVESGVAGMPTAFVARFRNGDGPVIAILAEFDALPGLAQRAVPQPDPIAGQEAGHGCGHHIFGAASVAAAQAVKAWMAANNIKGELRVYGAPAEEGGSGKVYLVREGLFKDVSATLHWHAADVNDASQGVSLANISGKFRFAGLSAHASASPEKGRSALDGVEIMNVAVNYLREHIPMGVRIHYVTTDGGSAPNVVPDKAEVYYYVRHTDPQVVRDVMARVQKAAEGAAIATETKVSFEQTGGVYNMLANDTLGRLMDQNLREVGGEAWDAKDIAFGEAMRAHLPPTKLTLDSVKEIQPYRTDRGSGGSTDVADVSWVTPTAGMTAATWVPGTPAHSWQAVAAGGTPIGLKGGVVAAKTLALTAADLFTDPKTIAKAQAELKQKRGADFTYKAMVGDRPPPLDYRRKSGEAQP